MKRETNEAHLEKIIKEAIHEEMNNGPSPPLSAQQAWDKLNQNRNHQKKQKFWKLRPQKGRRKWVYTTCVSLVLVSILSFVPNHGIAYSKITDMFQRIQGSVIHIFIKSGEMAETESGPSMESEEFTILEGSESVTEQVTLEEAKHEANFPIRIPKRIPQDFKLENVTIMKEQNEVNELYLIYSNGEQTFSINERVTGGSFGSGMVIDGEDTQVEQILINGKEASLITYKNDVIELIWLDESYYFSISGNISRENILMLAETL